MAASVSLTVNFRDGSTQTISHAVGLQDNHVVRYSELIQSLSYVQEQSNAVLTTLVNQEKSQKNGSGGDADFVVKVKEVKPTINSGNEQQTDEDEEEEEDSEEDDTDNPPPDKKKKT